MMKKFEIIDEAPVRLIRTEYTNVFSCLSPEQATVFEEKLKWGCRSALGIAQRARTCYDRNALKREGMNIETIYAC